MKRCFRWTKQQGYIEDNPIADLEVPAAESREVMIRRADFERLLSCCRDQTFRDVLVTAWETGCRPQELVKVTADHVGLANDRWVFKQSESKMKRVARVVYLGPESLGITKRLMAVHPAGPIFRNSQGRPWTMGAVNSSIKRLRTRMGRVELERNGGVTAAEVDAYLPKLSPTKTVKGSRVKNHNENCAPKPLARLAIRRLPALREGIAFTHCAIPGRHMLSRTVSTR